MPVTGCFSHLDTKDEKPGRITIISSDGASGDFPGCTDLAYEKAVKDGVDILDCNVKMSKDKIPFCMSSIDLLNTTNVFGTSFRNLSSTVAEIQERSGIYTFSLTMSQIKTLKRKNSTTLRLFDQRLNILFCPSLQLLFQLIRRTMLYSETQETKTLESFLHYQSSCFLQTVTTLSSAS